MLNLNTLAMLAKRNAFKRGKTVQGIFHSCTAADISRELTEFLDASEKERSEHIPEYTQAAEELADIIITCFTELSKRNVDIEKILLDKHFYNRTRVI